MTGGLGPSKAILKKFVDFAQKLLSNRGEDVVRDDTRVIRELRVGDLVIQSNMLIAEPSSNTLTIDVGDVSLLDVSYQGSVFHSEDCHLNIIDGDEERWKPFTLLLAKGSYRVYQEIDREIAKKLKRAV